MKYKDGKYEYSKDPILKKWLIFERHGSLLIEVFKGTTRQECRQWIKKQTRKRQAKCN